MAEVTISARGTEEAVAAPASFFTVSPPSTLPELSVAKGELPEEIFRILPSTLATHSRDVVDL
jgi:hypothetical protein